MNRVRSSRGEGQVQQNSGEWSREGLSESGPEVYLMKTFPKWWNLVNMRGKNCEITSSWNRG